jgi:eukaryotic-like serine/threonine-protein kinase
VDETVPGKPSARPARPAEFPEDWDRYLLEGFLGEGAMGAVFKARDRQLGRSVAVKLVRHADTLHRQRFAREASAQARVEHPHMCKVFEVGEVQGRPFIAMQLIDGKTLTALNADLTLQEKLRVIEQVAEALAAAHALGIVHRDIKPSNIMCEQKADGSLHPYVMDFGLARDLRQATLTQADTVVGTPAFMSPEQARGEHAGLDARADVYSLGATLYALVCGHPPFVSDSVTEVLMSVLNQPPPPLGRLVASLPRDVETIVMKCLEKDPARRYGSARALADDLSHFLAGRPIVARPPSRAYRLRLWLRRNRAVTALSAVGALVALGLGGVAVQARLDARRLATLAERFGGAAAEIEQRMRLASLSPEHDLNADREKLRARLTTLSSEVARAGAVAAGPGHYAMGRGLLALGDLAQARGELERAWAAGYRRPEVAGALGGVWERLWEGDRDKASREGANQGDRESEKATRARAAEWLKQARGSTLLDVDLLEAKIDYVEDRLTPARERAHAAYVRDPLLYEALLLEGRVSSKLGHKLAGKGDLAGARERYREAETALGQAARIARSDPEAQYQLCRLYDRVLEIEPDKSDNLAVEACRRAATVDPESDAAQGKLAIALNRLAERPGAKETAALLDESQKAAERAVATAPRFANHYRVLANTQRLRGEYDAAVATIERGLHADPDAKTAEKLLLTQAQIEIARGRDLLSRHQNADQAVAAALAAVDRARAKTKEGDYRILVASSGVKVLAVAAAAFARRPLAPLIVEARAEIARTRALTREDTPLLTALTTELDHYR